MGLFGNLPGKEKKESNAPPISENGTIRIEIVFDIKGVGVVPCGKVVSGTIAIGQTGFVDGKKIEVKTIERHHEQIAYANEGTSIGFSFRGDVNKNDFHEGMMIQFQK